MASETTEGKKRRKDAKRVMKKINLQNINNEWRKLDGIKSSADACGHYDKGDSECGIDINRSRGQTKKSKIQSKSFATTLNFNTWRDVQTQTM